MHSLHLLMSLPNLLQQGCALKGRSDGCLHVLSGNSTLQRLDVGHKGLTAASMHALQCAVTERGGLDTLIVSQNELGDNGAEALAPAVPLIREVHSRSLSFVQPQSWAPCIASERTLLRRSRRMTAASVHLVLRPGRQLWPGMPGAIAPRP